MPICLAVDNSADEFDLCDRAIETMFPAVGSDYPIIFRYRCDRCGHVGPEAFGPMDQMEEVREQAEVLFARSVSCQAMG